MNKNNKTQSGSWMNPAMLKWARETSGKPIEQAAARVKKSPEVLKQWENGEKLPTVRQARLLMGLYGRAFLELFLSQPPQLKEPEQIPDYRIYVGVRSPEDNREVKQIQQWAETLRTNALDLYDELGEHPPEFPAKLFTSINQDPSHVAAKARDAIGLTIQEQIGLNKSETKLLPKILRQKFEAIGILTFRCNELSDFGIRGMCLAIFPLPVIVFQSEAPTAQSFTLAHELGHVLTGNSAISGFRSQEYFNQPVEQWCDKFASAFLMPEELIATLLGDKPQHPWLEIEDEKLNRLAEILRISPHAVLIRLVHLGYVNADYYWTQKKPEFDRLDQEYKSYGRAPFYGRRYQSTLGDLYTSLVLEAWGSGRLTNHNAAEYMGIKNFNHLHDIRDHFVFT